MKCSVEKCEHTAIAKGVCDGHYRRLKKFGSAGVNVIPKMNRTLKEKFDDKWIPCSEIGCWIWIGADHDDLGYGVIRLNGKAIISHRASWMVHNGDIPIGQFVLHRCDNPWCVNPAHLFLGTQKENVADMVSKSRQQHGEKNGHSKLRESDVVMIRNSQESGYKLADRLGVSPSCIYGAKNRKAWAYIP